MCYDFKERRIVPTHSAIHTCADHPGSAHLKSWLVETSADWQTWREASREEKNKQLNGAYLSATFLVADGEEFCLIRLVNIGKNHTGSGWLFIYAWKIFGSLLE
jgi:hypothetical protein